jgi:hypothetical protein
LDTEFSRLEKVRFEQVKIRNGALITSDGIACFIVFHLNQKRGNSRRQQGTEAKINREGGCQE